MKIKFFPFSHFISLVSYGSLILFSLTGVILMQYGEVRKKDIPLTTTEYQKQEKEEKSELHFLSKTPALGLDNLLSDWAYLQYIQYFGDNEAREKTGYALIPDYFAQVVNRDPKFVDALARLEVSNSLFAGFPEKSVELLGQALQSNPHKLTIGIPVYYLWRAKGNNELLFLGDLPAAKQSYAKAIESAKAYHDEESNRIIDISKRSIKFLDKNPDSKLARIGAWVNVLGNRPDPKTVKRVIQEIENLGGKVVKTPDGNLTIQVPKNAT